MVFIILWWRERGRARERESERERERERERETNIHTYWQLQSISFTLLNQLYSRALLLLPVHTYIVSHSRACQATSIYTHTRTGVSCCETNVCVVGQHVSRTLRPTNTLNICVYVYVFKRLIRRQISYNICSAGHFNVKSEQDSMLQCYTS